MDNTYPLHIPYISHTYPIHIPVSTDRWMDPKSEKSEFGLGSGHGIPWKSIEVGSWNPGRVNHQSMAPMVFSARYGD